jgi:hypothetical protein
VGPSNILYPLFFLSYLVSFTIFSLSSCLFVCACIFFGFVLLLCVAIILSILLLCFAAMPWYYCFTLLLGPLYYCTLLSFRLATANNSTLLLKAPLCCYYKFHLTIIVPHCYYCSTIVVAIFGFLPYHVVAQPCCFSTFVVSLLTSNTIGLT